MIYIVAIMQPGKLESVQDALTELGVTGMTVSEVQGYGRQKEKIGNLSRRRISGEFYAKDKN